MKSVYEYFEVHVLGIPIADQLDTLLSNCSAYSKINEAESSAL